MRAISALQTQVTSGPSKSGGSETPKGLFAIWQIGTKQLLGMSLPEHLRRLLRSLSQKLEP